MSIRAQDSDSVAYHPLDLTDCSYNRTLPVFIPCTATYEIFYTAKAKLLTFKKTEYYDMQKLFINEQ